MQLVLLMLMLVLLLLLERMQFWRGVGRRVLGPGLDLEVAKERGGGGLVKVVGGGLAVVAAHEHAGWRPQAGQHGRTGLLLAKCVALYY